MSEFARMRGVSRQAVAQDCKGELSAACHDGMVDLDHEFAKKRLTRAAAPTRTPAEATKGGTGRPAGRPRKDAPAEPAKKPAAAPTRIDLSTPPANIEDIEQYGDLTLRQISARFGSITAHGKWLDMRKTQVDIKEKELKNGELEGKLIPREFVKTHVFGAIERMNKQLLQDASKTIARRLYGMAKSGETLENAETVVRELLSSNLRPAKEAAARALRGA
jgi:cell division protein FtsB